MVAVKTFIFSLIPFYVEVLLRVRLGLSEEHLN